MNDPHFQRSRRRVFAGAGALGALAATVAVLPRTEEAPSVTPDAEPAKRESGGYRLSAHVQRYYQTTKV